MATYYVSTSGNNSNSGTISSPWLTWNYAFNQLSAGDTLYIRGGTYYFTSAYGVSVSNKYGTAGSKITISNYGSEVPVLDGSNLTTSSERYGIYLENCRYFDITGLTVAYVEEYGQYYGCPLAHSISMSRCSDINFTRCVVHDCGNGFGANGFCNNISYINCDAYSNIDFADDGGFANGFTLTMYISSGVYASGTHVILSGCRSWGNSDDGFDMYGANGYFLFVNCWAFDNGRYGGNGDGFKTESFNAIESGIQRTYLNCLSFKNKGQGFYYEGNVQEAFYHCVAYDNGSNNFSCGYNPREIVEDQVITFRNNISYLTGGGIFGDMSSFVHDHNTWDSSVTITDADFLSTDSSLALTSRQSDGTLPVITLFHLALDSDLIGAGVDVGMDYDGAGNTWNDPPSIGAYEVVSSIFGGRSSITFSATAHFATLTCVPDSDVFCLQDVLDVVDPTVNCLQEAFDEADSDFFDPAYEGSHTCLSNFRNYCIHNSYDHIYSGDSADACVITFSTSATGTVYNNRAYGTGDIIFGTQATGTVTAGSIGGNHLIYGTTSITFSQIGTSINKITTTIVYGALYNWFAATDARNIANIGWRLPTRDDWETLALYIEPGATSFVNTIAPKLRETGLIYWSNNDGTNIYGFNARGAGQRNNDTGIFELLKYSTFWWNQGAMSSASGYTAGLVYDDDLFRCHIGGASYGRDKNYGDPIRLVKESTTLTHGQTSTFTGIDGKVYNTICIGTQEWMSENLAETKYRNGDSITIVTDNAAWIALSTEAMCFYNNDQTYSHEDDDLSQKRTSTGTTSITFTPIADLTMSNYPENLNAVQDAPETHLINVSWDAVTGTTGYILQRKPRFMGGWIDWYVSVYIGTDTSYADLLEDGYGNPLPNATDVTYRVCAYTGAGSGTYSPEETVTFYL